MFLDIPSSSKFTTVDATPIKSDNNPCKDAVIKSLDKLKVSPTMEQSPPKNPIKNPFCSNTSSKRILFQNQNSSTDLLLTNSKLILCF